MKIAFVLINANRREGTSRAVVEVAERLAKKHEVTLFSRSVIDTDLSQMNCCRIPGPAWPDVAEFESFRLQAERSIARQSFDIIHSAGCNVLHADVYAIQTVHPKKVEVTQSFGPANKVGLLRRLTRKLYDQRVISAERRAYQSSGKRGKLGFLPVSSGTERELREAYPVQDALVEVVPNGADLNQFTPELRRTVRNTLRQSLSIPNDRVVVLFAGGEWRRKGLQLAIEGVARAERSDLLLLVAGTDPSASEYQRLAKELGIESQLRWLGFRSDIAELYSAADLFLFPTYYEAFSLATIEAAATGLPVIMCEASGAEELLGDGLGGRIVPRDPDKIGATIRELASDLPLRHAMGQQAREKVERLFQWDFIAERTEAFYERLLSARKAGH
jgi:glycosyltransferase involved in cell wall biosynthesis